MKIAEFLQKLFEITGKTHYNNEYLLVADMLKIPTIKEGLLKCEEFENTKEIIFLEQPNPKLNINGEEKEYPTSVLKAYDGLKFKEKVYLHSIFLSPTIYDAKDMLHSVKDDVAITPLFFDDNDFTPKKAITIFFNPEQMQDEIIQGDEVVKEKIIEKLKKALENPEEYRMKEKRAIMIRGLNEQSIEPYKEDSSLLKGQIVQL